MTTFLRDPDAVLDYSVDWTSFLADTETITSHSVEVPAGLTLDTSTESSGVVTAWISGGTAGDNYTVTYRITTSEGRTDDRSLTLVVRER